jgi:hypothetical protein
VWDDPYQQLIREEAGVVMEDSRRLRTNYFLVGVSMLLAVVCITAPSRVLAADGSTALPGASANAELSKCAPTGASATGGSVTETHHRATGDSGVTKLPAQIIVSCESSVLPEKPAGDRNHESVGGAQEPRNQEATATDKPHAEKTVTDSSADNVNSGKPNTYKARADEKPGTKTPLQAASGYASSWAVQTVIAILAVSTVAALAVAAALSRGLYIRLTVYEDSVGIETDWGGLGGGLGGWRFSTPLVLLIAMLVFASLAVIFGHELILLVAKPVAAAGGG